MTIAINMNTILSLIDKRNLYVHLLLLKIYKATSGNTRQSYPGDLQKDMQNLLEEQYDQQAYDIAVQYIVSEDLIIHPDLWYVSNISDNLIIYPESWYLSNYGRAYIEDWVIDFQRLDEIDKKDLTKALPQKVYNWLGFSPETRTAHSFIHELLDMVNK